MFRCEDMTGGCPTLWIEYDADAIRKEWGANLFESPGHYSEVSSP